VARVTPAATGGGSGGKERACAERSRAGRCNHSFVGRPRARAAARCTSQLACLGTAGSAGAMEHQKFYDTSAAPTREAASTPGPTVPILALPSLAAQQGQVKFKAPPPQPLRSRPPPPPPPSGAAHRHPPAADREAAPPVQQEQRQELWQEAARPQPGWPPVADWQRPEPQAAAARRDDGAPASQPSLNSRARAPRLRRPRGASGPRTTSSARRGG
jgi:hypothetical protein